MSKQTFPMNIVYGYNIFSWQRYGGISRYFYEIANRIAALPENKVEIFAPLYVNEYFTNDSMVRPWGIKTIPFLGSQHVNIIQSTNHYLSRILLKRRHGVDIYHETYYSMSDYCPFSAKRIVTVYDMIHEKYSEYFPDASMVHQMKSLAVRRADHVICISENTKRDLIELLVVPEEKITVVYLGCSLAKSDKQKARNPFPCQKPFILFVGDRSGYKNFERFLLAYASSSFLKSEFDVICFGGGELSPSHSALIQSLDIAKGSVRHLAGNDDILSGLYLSATAFVYPSLYEGFGIPLLEAMSLGCPVVCANTSSIPEVVGDAAELFDPYDESAMGSAIERVVSTPQYATMLVEKGRRRASLFSWEKCVRDTLCVYHNVLDG